MNDIIDINRTISKELFMNVDYSFKVIDKINKYIIDEIDKSRYTEIGNNIFIGDNVVIDKYATIIGPCVIDDNTKIEPGAYIRENVIVGKNCIIGNSTEIKNSILFDNCQLSHYNYVGDSILGYNVHLGAGVVLSNLKNDETNISIKSRDMIIDTEYRKFGSIVGDNTVIGCNSVLYPGTVIGMNTSIYPLVRVRGVIGSGCIVKSENLIVDKN